MRKGIVPNNCYWYYSMLFILLIQLLLFSLRLHWCSLPLCVEKLSVYIYIYIYTHIYAVRSLFSDSFYQRIDAIMKENLAQCTIFKENVCFKKEIVFSANEQLIIRRGGWVGRTQVSHVGSWEFSSQSSETNDLQKLYLSLHSLMLSIIGWFSGRIMWLNGLSGHGAGGLDI